MSPIWGHDCAVRKRTFFTDADECPHCHERSPPTPPPSSLDEAAQLASVERHAELFKSALLSNVERRPVMQDLAGQVDRIVEVVRIEVSKPRSHKA